MPHVYKMATDVQKQIFFLSCQINLIIQWIFLQTYGWPPRMNRMFVKVVNDDNSGILLFFKSYFITILLLTTVL